MMGIIDRAHIGTVHDVTDLRLNDKAALYAQKNAAASPLLRLPAEIRNRIYEYALTTGDELIFKTADGESQACLVSEDCWYDSEGQCGAFNQVKYTCRQLYRETAGLEVKFNTVKFYQGNTPAKGFLDFLATCSPAKRSWFSSVRLDRWDPTAPDYVIEPASTLLQLLDYCKQNPGTIVKYIPTNFGVRWEDESSFIFVGLWLNGAVRGKNIISPSSSAYPESPAWFEDMTPADTWADKNSIALLDVPNLRFWPLETFQNSTFSWDSGSAADKQLWRSLREEWIKNGI